MFLCSCVFFRKGPMGARSCDPGSACPFHPAGKPHIYLENTRVWMPINQNQYLLVSCHYVFFGSLISQQLPVPQPTASFGRGGLGAQDDAQDGMILHVGHAGHAADLAVQEASGLRFYLWSLWTLVQAGGFRSNLDTMAKSKRIERLTAWFLGQAWSQAVASESQQLLAGSNVLNCQTYQKNACFPTGYWINSSILSIRTHVGYYHYWRIPNLP